MSSRIRYVGVLALVLGIVTIGLDRLSGRVEQSGMSEGSKLLAGGIVTGIGIATVVAFLVLTGRAIRSNRVEGFAEDHHGKTRTKSPTTRSIMRAFFLVSALLITASVAISMSGWDESVRRPLLWSLLIVTAISGVACVLGLVLALRREAREDTT